MGTNLSQQVVVSCWIEEFKRALGRFETKSRRRDGRAYDCLLGLEEGRELFLDRREMLCGASRKENGRTWAASSNFSAILQWRVAAHKNRRDEVVLLT